MKVSLVVTVKEEEKTIGAFLDSVLCQRKRPAEMVIVDGGSMDGTARAITRFMEDRRISFSVKFIRLWGANIAAGRNLGIMAARHDILAVSDAGCTLDEAWLQEMTDPFAEREVGVVAGNYVVRTEGFWEAAAAAMTIPDPERIANGLSSSRSIAFRREVWEKVGGYPEQLDWAEDTAFSLAVRRLGITTRFAKKAVVFWKTRNDPLSLFVQYFRYAYGDGTAGHFRRHYLVRGAAASVMIGLSGVVCSNDREGWLLLPAGLILIYWLYFVRKVPMKMRTLRHLLLSLPVLLICDTARVLGYLYGHLRGGMRRSKVERGPLKGGISLP